ncbi:hypothetical protein MMC25_006569 [Agyrium rufum]|nr:hypothetical protein [Agyrium rufum]
MDEAAIKPYLADAPPTIVKLEIGAHFDGLTDREKLYAHHLSRASHYGTRIILRSVSLESETIYDIILALYDSCKGDWKELQSSSGVSDGDFKAFVEYAAQFMGNLGNYKSFGDSKFVPRLFPESLEKLVAVCPKAKELYQGIKSDDGGIFANTKKSSLMHFGYPDRGLISAYYPDSPDITEEEISYISHFMGDKKLLPENTRLKKLKSGDFELLIASAVLNPPADVRDAGELAEWQLDGKLQGKRLTLVYGDHQEEMAKIALSMKKAAQYAADDLQKTMMEAYAKSFSTGSMAAFLDSQKSWVKDLGPKVESNIGFIESDRDPAGVRSEWEGWVAMVNQERTRAFKALVDSASKMIPKLPWSKDFEKDKFLAPDFTSLEVLTFATSGLPAGINLPNFESIRAVIGFKNVSLGNVLSAKAPNQPIPFIHADDVEAYRKLSDSAFEVQVGIHELLGHGSGKVLQETSPGVLNFDKNNPPTNPLTNKPVQSYYLPGQTYSSVFGNLSSSYEECRAESCAMDLGCDYEILQIFGFGNGQEDLHGTAGDVLWTMYLSMARAGVVALEFWDPKSGKWGQNHMRARYAILQVFLEAGEDFTTLSHSADDLSDLVIRVDRSKILSVGRPAVSRFLQKLHIYKCTADVKAANELYNKYTSVNGFWAEKVRPTVMAKKMPRKVFVQANTVEKDGKVQLKEYEATPEGMIRSFAERDV